MIFIPKVGYIFLGKNPNFWVKKLEIFERKSKGFFFWKKQSRFFFFLRISKKKKGCFFCWNKIMKNLIHFWSKNRVLPPPSILSTPRQKNVIPHAKSGIFLHPPPPPPRRKKAYFGGFLLYWNGPYRNLIDDYPLYLNYYPKIMQNIIPFFTCITKAFYTTMSKKTMDILVLLR